MDPLDTLAVRFHLGGEFLNDGKKLHYCGGKEAMSNIDRDKISLPELVGHLRDHYVVKEGTLLHWLFPGKELDNGLRALVDDQACQYMAHCITDGGVADVFVEDPPTEIEEANVSDFEDELVDMDDGQVGSNDEVVSDDVGGASEDNEEVPKKHLVSVTKGPEPREKIEREISMLREFYRSLVKMGKEICLLSHDNSSGKRDAQKGFKNDESASSEDSDYVPGDACSSEEDEEAHEILKMIKNFKKKLRSGGVASLDDVELTDNGPN